MVLSRREMLVGIGIAVVLLLGASSIAAAKTLTRTCKGATLVRYKVGDKSYALLGPYKFTAESTSSGAVPSPVKARRRACEKAAQAAADTIETRTVVPTVCSKHYGADEITFVGGIGSSKGERQYVNHLGSSSIHIRCSDYGSECGNGIVEDGEYCDDGDDNSDSDRDACRSSCHKAGCGDGVADSAEDCDGDDVRFGLCEHLSSYAGYPHSTPHYWGGRLKCTIDCEFDVSDCWYCGDRETQSPFEECDDGNSIDDDGCNTDCTVCVSLDPNGQSTNIEVVDDTEICTRNYEADDYGELGAVIIRAPNLTLDCDGASLTGTGDGVGIYVQRSDNVTITNCTIDSYQTGIYVEDSKNVGIQDFDNVITNTTQEVVLDEDSTERAPQPPPPPRKPTRRPKRSRSGPDG